MQYVISTLLSQLGKPYIWGGQSPLIGWDCNGLIHWGLDSAGLDTPTDRSAQGLFDWFDVHGERDPRPGAGVLAFYGKSVAEITHVAFMLDRFRIIEAGGGDRSCLTLADAIQKRAYVRIRHVSARTPIALRKPRYATIGLI